jgi:hypothetical protein
MLLPNSYSAVRYLLFARKQRMQSSGMLHHVALVRTDVKTSDLTLLMVLYILQLKWDYEKNKRATEEPWVLFSIWSVLRLYNKDWELGFRVG